MGDHSEHLHSHAGHHHHHSAVENIKLGFLLNLSFTIIEVIGGIMTNSLAILSDALHDLGDSISLGLSWYLEKVAHRPKSRTFTYGYKRFSLLAALINGLILVIGSLIILAEAIPRLFHPEHSEAKGMLLLAIVGILVNGVAALRLRKGRTLNERVVTWHFLEDVLSWVTILIVSLVMMIREIRILDPLLSILLTLYVLWNVVKNLHATFIVFLQGVPAPMSLAALEDKILELPDILAVHDSHIWSLDGAHFILSGHVVVEHGLPEEKIIAAKCDVKRIATELGIQHTTVEVEFEHETCELKE
jgi:cobalt-zinc-cadmium efflux system protein